MHRIKVVSYSSFKLIIQTRKSICNRQPILTYPASIRSFCNRHYIFCCNHIRNVWEKRNGSNHSRCKCDFRNFTNNLVCKFY